MYLIVLTWIPAARMYMYLIIVTYVLTCTCVQVSLIAIQER